MLRGFAGFRKCALFCAVLALMGCSVDAQKRYPQRVQFAHGQSWVKIENSVVRGTRNRYLAAAKAGQTMTVSISSLENNAVFSIARPDGKYLPDATDESDATHWSGKLPESGDFVLEVGGTRGNAKYVLNVAIK
jgi:hypothetical protein